MKRMSVAGWMAAVALVLGTGVMSAQATQWKIDPMHSEADFAIKHMAISTVHGSFHGLSGVITFDPANVAKSSVEATIPVDTVDTGVAPRDTDLKSPRFFDATQFPTMTFKSTSVRKAGDHYDVAGDLTLHGVTKPVVLKLEEPGKEEIGMDKKSVLQRFLDAMPARFVVAEGDIQMNAILADVDESTGRARSIDRLNFRLD